MKKLFVLTAYVAIFTSLDAQVKKHDNPGLDSLKQSFKAVGNLFKKSNRVDIKINEIKSGDQNLARLIQNLQHLPGVVSIKSAFQESGAMLAVSYKGKGTDLWNAVPQNSKQVFSPVALSDTAIELSYKYATVSSQRVSSSSNRNAAAVNSAPVQSVPQKNGDGTLSKGATLLFRNIKSKLNTEDKNWFFETTEFKLSKDGKQFVLHDPDAADYPFDAFLYPADINKDGVEELFLVFGNSYTSGGAGSTIVAYIADKQGKYIANLGFPGTLPDVLRTANLGYPDLLIGGPGFEFPVWRWNGKEYVFHKKEKVDEKSYAKLNPISLETLSKNYMASLK